ncbi:hypothetical protein GOP47_0010948 [Adiantum capillus-veneris]|uniref:Pentatricopeptide repeat-containing protein n=1 Tax=Adiantum capillus-veneris TaxID=13818 RepID=A0A9D4UWD2_ADICA|nr:hypothetical protein GOP47_0010948 [Adiantum capillus-veneris]
MSMSKLDVGNTLADVFAKHGLLGNAQQVFENLPLQDAISWNSLLVDNVKHGHGDQAVECCEKMQGASIALDFVTCICALKAFCNIGAPGIHADLGRQGVLEQDPVVGHALLDMYCKFILLSIAKEVFDVLPLQDDFTLLARCVEHGTGEEAHDFFERMQSQCVSADAVIFLYELKFMKALCEALKLHTIATQYGVLSRDIRIQTTLVIEMYAKAGLLTKEQKIFDKLPQKSSVTWNVLIASYTKYELAN